jgi:monoamine oxidase
MTQKRNATVAVVGAGLSGLTAALRLTQAGHEVMVLEAKDRVGGRTARHEFEAGGKAQIIDAGGQYTGPGQDELHRLAAEVGVTKQLVYRDGDTIRHRNGVSRRVRADAGDLEGESLRQYSAAIAKFDELSTAVPAREPWRAPEASALDARTLGAWVRENVADAEARETLETEMKLVVCLDLERVSLLHGLRYCSSCDGWAQQLRGEDYRFAESAHEISVRVAAQLGDRVHLGLPVRHIEQADGEQVTIVADGMTVTADRCIVAMSPTDCRGIAFTPDLPASRQQLIGQWVQASVIKAQAVYETPFWREDGLSGLAISDIGTTAYAWDNSPTDGSCGLLITFLFPIPEGAAVGTPTPVLEDAALRRATILQNLATYFGPRALTEIDFLDKDWLYEPFSAGCQPAPPPGLYTQFGHALTAPVERVHWAGTETASRWIGWMNGAVESGERVAAEVASVIGPVAHEVRS